MCSMVNVNRPCRQGPEAHHPLFREPGRLLVPTLLVVSVLTVAVRGDERVASPEALAQFRTEAFPVLKKSCFGCHGAARKLKGHFRVTSRAGLLHGGDRGPAIDLANPTSSLLLAMVSYSDDQHQMPPSGKLPPEELAALARWVELGAHFDPALEILPEPGAEEEHDPTQVNDQSRAYWAFRPLAGAGPPGGNAQNPIDAFVEAKLATAGLQLSEPAPRRELLRRVYQDLIGLPPTLEEVEAFEQDDSPDAFERVVDRLLASPRHGERWGRHWLDVVRYAESNGYERDGAKPMAYGYRDWVIRSLNEDKPYDQFLREQLAGDELEDADADSIAGTGYYRLGLWDDEPADPALARFDYLDSIAATTGEAMLGLTVGCARCHDHKIDPFPQRDYYKLLSFFINVSPHGMGDANLVEVSTREETARAEREAEERRSLEARLLSRIWELEQAFLGAARENLPRCVEGVVAPPDLVDLRYWFYRDSWDSLPDFKNLRHETTGTIPDGLISLAPALRRDAMGLVFEGLLRVPVTGEYSFEVHTRGGTRLTVDGKVLGENLSEAESSHGGTIALRSGHVPFRFEYFTRKGEPRLEVEWRGPGFDRRQLSSAGEAPRVLVADARQGQPVEWRYRLADPGEGWQNPDFPDQGWKRGPGGFGQAGTPGSVVHTPWRREEIWLRKKFEVRGQVRTLSLTIHHDDEVKVWLNGHVVFEGEGFRTDYLTRQLDQAAAFLREGDNVLAVHCKQNGGGQYIDLGLADEGLRSGLSERIAEHGVAVFGETRREEYFRLKGALAESRLNPPRTPVRKVMAVGENGRKETHVLLRGNPGLVGDKVEPGFPSVLSPPEPAIVDRGASSGRRLALARWITSQENPLTPRVAANRLWQHHFGRGIVRSSSNFGRIGDRPTHPELLDWLAGELLRQGWRLKPLHRLIVLSRTYQQSSRSRPSPLAKDPQNDLFWRFDARRLSAEEIRDSMLGAAGRLNLKAYGPSIYPELPQEILVTSSTGAEKWGKSPPEEIWRRSVYIFLRRSLLDPMLTTFDLADTDSSCAVRFATTVPTQALTLLNSSFVNDQAEALGRRAARAGSTLEDQVNRAIELALCRRALPGETTSLGAFVRGLEADLGESRETALARLGLLLLNSNEFVFVD